MSSNTSAGERRWASARRGGMTVLGKVAVPKPLNLPSQRLENHGLDPNVEIVPKGTLSWGSRPSSSGSNPWISSTSPNADGGTVSPSHLSGRPSSGGSGTRPSTAGSDKTQEPVGNAWGSNSRPSSASGTLSSSQTSSSTLRPRSAENRPNSSQLSRFAEPASKTSVAWGPSSTAERLGVKASNEGAFSLTSGDFPTLGSEKDNLARNIESGDSGRPSSASGRIAQIKEDTKLQAGADTKHGTVNTWRSDGTRSTEDDIHPSLEKWPGDHHQYINANAPPQHFDAWRGPSNGPAGVWYGGRPRAPAFGGPVPPGGFPVEPFPYYHPQMPPPPLAGSQPVPHRGPGPGPGPRGPHPKNGDFYRPKVHDSYARPGMPFRPGFYSGPPGPHGPMPFEGFYGPPMGYCNSERDIPYMGMAAGPPVYNGYAAPRPEVGDSHGRAGGHPGQMEADYLEDTKGPKRAPVRKHHEYNNQREEGENQKNTMQPHASYPVKNLLPMISKKSEWGAEVDAEEAFSSKRPMPNEMSSRSYEYQVLSGDSRKVKSFERTGNVKEANAYCRNDSGDEPSFHPDILSHTSEKDSSKPVVAKSSILMRKIDGLNAKVRVFDGRNDGSSGYNRDEEWNRSQVVDLKNNKYTDEFGNTTEHVECTQHAQDTTGPPELIGPISDKPIQSMVIASRGSSHGGHDRVDHRGKGRFSQDGDGWRKHPNTESSSELRASNVESASNINAHGPNLVVEASENSSISLTGMVEGDSVETLDSSDNQRSKMRELAKQRALQLQKEEEERTREQKAKALAKLEELNRRTSAGETANQKADQSQATGDIQIKQGLPGEFVVVDQRSQAPGLNLVSNPDVNATNDGNNVNTARENTISLELNITPLSLHEDAHDDNVQKGASRFNDGGLSRHKRTGYKQKHNNSLQKTLNETSVSVVASDAQKDYPLVATGEMTSLEDPCEIKPNESKALNASSTVAELLPGHQRRKGNRTSKSKHKVAETPPSPAVPPVISDTNTGKEPVETSKSKGFSNVDSSVLNVSEHDSGAQGHGQDLYSSLPCEESHGRVPNQWKPNTSRKLPRNQQSNRFMGKLHGSDTAVWAPVPTQNKNKGPVAESQNSMQDGSADAGQNFVQESANSTKGDNTAQSSSKGKRAEMERYVPKPVAKELAQQGSIPPVSSSSARSSRSNEGPGREQSGSVGSVHPQPVWSNIEHEGDGNHNKPKNDHGIWKQRSSIDTSHAKHLQFGDIPPSEITKDIQQSKEGHQSVKSEINPANAQPKYSGSVNSSAGNDGLNNPTTAVGSSYPSARDLGATGRGKRHPPRGPRSTTGNNPDSESGIGSEVDGSSVGAPVVNKMDRAVISKENRSSGERTSSQWLPKSQLNLANNQQGNRPESETAEINRPLKKDNHYRKVQPTPRHDNEPANVTQLQQGQLVNVESNKGVSIVGQQQEIEKEKKPAPAKRRPYSPNQDPLGFGESAPNANTDNQTERNIPPGSRRNTRQNTRFSRGGHESRGDWSGGHDSRPHNASSFRDRQRQNVHYEYQPIGQPGDRGAEGMDHRRRERGQSHHPKHGGNYYRRQTQTGGSVNVDSQD